MTVLKLLSELAHSTHKQYQDIIKSQPKNILDAFTQNKALEIKYSLQGNKNDYFPNERSVVNINIK